MKLRYNSPVILTFTFLSIAVMATIHFTQSQFIDSLFSVGTTMDFYNPLDYFRLVSHVSGHANWPHLIGNFSYILLLGPLIEEKYGSWSTLQMILVTAIFTSIINIIFFNNGLHGASGIVFMLILLSSMSNFKSGEVPLTFLMVAIFYIGGEVTNSFKADNISQFGHIFGGICGSFFGFLLKGHK
ncbi:MAG: rhomboid family intramembrane serine protease [Candidatus Cloacimonadota bacterium]|nr:MAG: rhomboid family intramembrane serine protease [Candidatus Cloacimonadota bacterium]